MRNFERVKGYLAELDLPIIREDAEEELVVIDDATKGLKNLVVDCEAPILVLEQFIADLKDPGDAGALMRLLQMNRTLVHGAFAVDESGGKLLFRDTLALENLDLNELESSVKALTLALAENAEVLLKIAKTS